MAAPRGPNPAGQQKQLSPVIKLVLEHNPDDLAAWRESCGVSEESFDILANKKREPVNSLMRPGPKAFGVASQTLASLVEADTDASLSASDISSLKTEVFAKTAAAIAKAEKEKAEAAKAEAEANKAKKKKEAAKETSGEVRNFADFLARTLGSAARTQRQARFLAFSQLLTPAQKQNFAAGLKEGDQAAKFEALTECAAAPDAVTLAEINGWI